MHRQSSAGNDALALGVKSRLSNQEMETLRAKVCASICACAVDTNANQLDECRHATSEQLAQAVAYDHVPCDAKRAARLVKAQHAAKPMTKLYHRVGESNARSSSSFRPGGALDTIEAPRTPILSFSIALIRGNMFDRQEDASEYPVRNRVHRACE